MPPAATITASGFVLASTFELAVEAGVASAVAFCAGVSLREIRCAASSPSANAASTMKTNPARPIIRGMNEAYHGRRSPLIMLAFRHAPPSSTRPDPATVHPPPSILDASPIPLPGSGTRTPYDAHNCTPNEGARTYIRRRGCRHRYESPRQP